MHIDYADDNNVDRADDKHWQGNQFRIVCADIIF